MRLRSPLSRRRLRRLRELTWLEWRDLVRAQLTLIYVQFLIWLLPRGKLVGKSQHSAAEGAEDAAPLPRRVRQLELGIARAADHGLLRPDCLVRAIALQRMIEAHGFSGARVRVGVRRNGSQFLAHAWVEYQGHVLGDAASRVSSFDQIAPLEFFKR